MGLGSSSIYSMDLDGRNRRGLYPPPHESDPPATACRNMLAPATLVSMSTSGARRVVKQLHISLTSILAVCHESVLPCPPSFDVWYVPSLYVLLQTYPLHIIGNLSTRGAAYTVLPGRELTVLSQE